MGSLDVLIRDLKKFENRREVVKQLRKRIRKPVPNVRRAIKARALAILPARGGLNAWVGKSRVAVVVKLAGRAAGVKLRAGRNSEGGRSDIRRIDQGRVRAPSWGRKGAGDWHSQTVQDGFFTNPVVESTEWRAECVRALDDAAEVIRSG